MKFSVVTEYDGWPNGLKIHKDGRIFIADYKNGIMELDPVNGKISPYVVRAGLEHFKAVNDLFFAANGDLYFTDQGLTGYHDPSGRLFRLHPSGRIDCLLDNVPSPNGLVMNLEENVIYPCSYTGERCMAGTAESRWRCDESRDLRTTFRRQRPRWIGIGREWRTCHNTFWARLCLGDELCW